MLEKLLFPCITPLPNRIIPSVFNVIHRGLWSMGCHTAAIVASVAGAVISGAVASDSARKARNAQSDAAKASQVDIDALNEQTKKIATQNALDSRALEQQLTPEVPQLRTAANNAVLAGLNEDPSITAAKQRLTSGLGQNLNTPLLTAAIEKARADLAMGGKLSTDTQNAVTRKGLASTGALTGNLGLGRDIVARDLGLTSQQMENQRLTNAFTGGGMEQNLATDNATNLLNQINLLNTLNANQRSYALGAAQYGQGIQQPIVGLDPTAIANIKIGNSNAAGAASANQGNIYGQQSNNWMNMAGQLGGTALMAYANRSPSTTPTSSSSWGTSGTGVHS